MPATSLSTQVCLPSCSLPGSCPAQLAALSALCESCCWLRAVYNSALGPHRYLGMRVGLCASRPGAKLLEG